MPRRPATQRHLDSAPADDTWPPTGDDVVEALIALHHPARRQLYELLTMHGPAPVGRLAEVTNLAPGSVSHHLKALHRTGFVVPAPDLARDTRESWWRGLRRRFRWSANDYADGTAARNIALIAERANLDHHNHAIIGWMRTRDALPAPWRDVGNSRDDLVAATVEQTAELISRLEDLLTTWSEGCRADALVHPDADRRAVRAITRVFPSESV